MNQLYPCRIRRIWMRRVLFFLALFSFFIIAALVRQQNVTAADAWLSPRIYAIRSDGLTTFFTAVTYLGNWQVITASCILLLFFSGTRRAWGIPLTLGAITSVICYEALKQLFERPRPDISLHLISQGGYSFPSGHALTAMVFYGLMITLICRHRRPGWLRWLFVALFAVLIFLIGFSRVYLGVHYPTDVLAGWSLGLCLTLAFTSNLIRRWAVRESYWREACSCRSRD